MLTHSQSFSLARPKADGFDEPRDSPLSLEQRICALEAELAASRRLVGYLLEKNEELRVRLRRDD